jgi:N-acetylmuramoyl-L-alanine amidase
VLDIDGIDVSSELAELPARVHPTDPYIAAIRLGRKAPNVMRIVLDLKSEVKPDLFALKPVAEYGHRLVLDLYPQVRCAAPSRRRTRCRPGRRAATATRGRGA